MKKILVIIGLCLLAGYLIFAAFFFKDKPSQEICSRFEVVSIGAEGTTMIDLAEIERDIDSKQLNPYGKPISTINTNEIEEVILTHRMVKKASVFVTSNGGIRAEIEERQPILRIISNTGESYYIDKEGERVPLSKFYVADLPLATGAISERLAKTELFDFAQFLITNDFWNNQIEQIYVLSNDDVKLIPRVGNHEILLGKLEGYQEKLSKLRTFYEQGLSEVGWNRYSSINLKYDEQVVGVKR